MRYFRTVSAAGASGAIAFFCWTISALGQVPTVQSVTSAASNNLGLCPGVVASVVGNFGKAKAQVTVGGKRAYLFYDGSTQLLVQIPVELSAGPTTLTVSTTAGTSTPFNLTLGNSAPGLYSANFIGSGPGAFTDASGNAISTRNPSHPGGSVTIVATGLGSTIPSVPTGSVAAIGAPAAQAPVVRVGGSPAQVLFAGLVGTQDISLIGTYHITFNVPPNAPAGNDDVVVSLGGQTSNTVTLPVSIALPVVTSVVNGASLAKGPIAPGSLASVFVSNIGTTDNLNLFPATTFAGLFVTFNGILAPLFRVSASTGQIDVLVPPDLPTNGVVNVQVQTTAGNSAIFPITMAPAAPGIFRIGTNASAQIAGTSWIPMPATLAATLQIPVNCSASGISITATCAQPAAPGDFVTISVTGLGKATPDGDPNGPALPNGQTAPVGGKAAYNTVITPQVTVGGTPVKVLFSGLAPGYAGLYQVNFQIPNSISDGDAIPITISSHGNVDSAPIAVAHR